MWAPCSPPEWRRTSKHQCLRGNLPGRVHPRRFDRETGQWVDGDTLRVTGALLAQARPNMSRQSVQARRPGHRARPGVDTRDWTDDQGEKRVPRTSWRRISVGHDLRAGCRRSSRGRKTPERWPTWSRMRTQRHRVGRRADSRRWTVSPPADPMRTADAGMASLGRRRTTRSRYCGQPDWTRPTPLKTSMAASRGDRARGRPATRTSQRRTTRTGRSPSGAADGSGGSSGRSRRRGRQPVPA